MKIAHIITRLINGGADENTVYTCNYSAEAGHEVVLIHGRDTDAEILSKLSKQVRLIPIHTLIRPIQPIHDLRALFQLTKTLLDIRPDVVHTHTSKAGILGRAAARIANAPVIVHGIHIAPFINVSALSSKVFLVAEKLVDLYTDAYISVSGGMRDAYLSHNMGSPQNHYVVPSGFDLDRFRKATPPANWRQILGIGDSDEKPTTLLMVAALEPRKQHIEFLKSFPIILREFPNVRLLLAGDGHLRNDIEATVRDLRLDRNVKVLGFCNEPETLMALADICLLSSAREGLPRVIMQYLAAGKPCVAMELPGLDEVLIHRNNGLVLPQGDWTMYMDAVIGLLQDKKELQRLREGAVASPLERWSTTSMGAQTLAIYSQLTSTPKA